MRRATLLGAAVLLGVADLAQGLCGLSKHQQELGHASTHLATVETMAELQERILLRFKHLDGDGDGSVSLAEMKRGFDHEPVEEGEAILSRMLSDCAGSAGGAGACTLGAMEGLLEAWRTSRGGRAAVALLQSGSSSGFGSSIVSGNASTPDNGDPCGPSAEARPAEPFAEVRCTWQGPRCWQGPNILAWLQRGVCQSAACICEGTRETKRLAKVGLMGAAAVTTAMNFTDEGDTLLLPACGSGWTSRKIAGYLDHLAKASDWTEKLRVQVAAPKLFDDQTIVDALIKVDDDYTEVAIYKSANHHIRKDRSPGKICMMSWQATRSPGDWKTNLMTTGINFRYAPRRARVTAPKGLVLAYESTREALKRAFEEECCSPDFRADKVVISGHSHGGALAELHAVDVVTNWECPRGRDLGAEDIAVVLAAPHSSMLSMSVINHIFSCADPAGCLAGSVVTLTTVGDKVGDSDSATLDSGTPRHPSKVTMLPCGKMPQEAAIPGQEQSDADWWCHGMFNYVGTVETELVGKQGWGSSCGGECGDPNWLVQCNQYVLLKYEGCAYANASLLKPRTSCPNSRWLAHEERCDCHYDKCTDLTTMHCKA